MCARVCEKGCDAPHENTRQIKLWLGPKEGRKNMGKLEKKLVVVGGWVIDDQKSDHNYKDEGRL